MNAAAKDTAFGRHAPAIRRSWGNVQETIQAERQSSRIPESQRNGGENGHTLANFCDPFSWLVFANRSANQVLRSEPSQVTLLDGRSFVPAALLKAPKE
jgi:hypothetical protein